MFKFIKERPLLIYFIVVSGLFGLIEPVYEYFQSVIFFNYKEIDYYYVTELLVTHIIQFILFVSLIFSFEYFFNTKKKSLIILKYRMLFFLLLLVYTTIHIIVYLNVNFLTNLFIEPPIESHSIIFENFSKKILPYIILADFKTYIGLFFYILLSRGMLSTGTFFINYRNNNFSGEKPLAEQQKQQNNILTESMNPEISEIFVKKRDRELFIDVQNILYFQSSGNYMEFSNGEELFSVRSTTKDIANRLPRAFIQIHRSSIVNLTKISHVSTKQPSNKVSVSLTNGESFTVSRSYQKEFKDVWKNMNVTHEK